MIVSINNSLNNSKIYIEDFFYKKKDFSFSILSILAHLIFLLPMISFTFNKDKITDVPLILPVEMFIIEEKTEAPEFEKEINEVIPDMIEEIQDTKELPVDDVVKIEAAEEILASESNEEKTDFVIEKKIKPKEVIKEKILETKNDFEIKLKIKPETKEVVEEPEVEIVLKKKPKKKSFNVSKVLKDIEQESKEFKKTQETTENKQAEVFTDEVGKNMTISEIELLRQQLYSCYTVPAGAKELGNIKVQVQILVNPDRTVKEAIIKNSSKMNSDPYFRTAGEAALSAFNDPNCSTLKLPADKYEEWKEINFTFDFSWMFEQV